MSSLLRKLLILLFPLLTLLPVLASLANDETDVYLPSLTFSLAPPPALIHLEPYATGFDTETITFIVNAADPRLFIGEQEGDIRVITPTGLKIFLDLEDRVRTTNWEEGLLGMAFHPDYASNGYFYVSYNHQGKAEENGAIRISRFEVKADNPDEADPTSEVVLMEINKPYDSSLPPPTGGAGPSPVHNAGDMHFGPDGYLYIAIGDGGPDPDPGDPDPGDPYNNGQRLDKLLGKILRIDVNDTVGFPPDCGALNEGLEDNYTIPPDNPFITGPGEPCDEIWASGLRNPWRFSFDRKTGDMYITDVGEWEREEINFQPAQLAGGPYYGGRNYGWRCWEGNFDHTGADHIQGQCTTPEAYTFPIHDYLSGSSQEGCSVIGGYVYRGSLYPSLIGRYLFADFCHQKIMLMTPGEWQAVRVDDLARPWSTFGEGYDGELYIANRFLFGQQGAFAPAVYHITVP